MVDPAPLNDHEAALVAEALRANRKRVQKVIGYGGRILWIKRVERLSWLGRLQKGDPVAAFQAERVAIRGLEAIGQPVPVILQEGPEHLVMADAGGNLHNLLLKKRIGDDDARVAFAEVGRVLARLHREGYVHGRPVLRDFCWDGSRVTMIDLERFELRRRRVRTQALDLVIFIQGWFSRRDAEDNEAALLDVAMQAYRAEAPAGPWSAIGKWVRMLNPLRPVLRLALRLRPEWREVQAALWTLDYLADHA